MMIDRHSTVGASVVDGSRMRSMRVVHVFSNQNSHHRSEMAVEIPMRRMRMRMVHHRTNHSVVLLDSNRSHFPPRWDQREHDGDVHCVWILLLSRAFESDISPVVHHMVQMASNSHDDSDEVVVEPGRAGCADDDMISMEAVHQIHSTEGHRDGDAVVRMMDATVADMVHIVRQVVVHHSTNSWAVCTMMDAVGGDTVVQRMVGRGVHSEEDHDIPGRRHELRMVSTAFVVVSTLQEECTIRP